MSRQQFDTCTRKERRGCLAFTEYMCLNGDCKAWTDNPHWRTEYYRDAAAAGYEVQIPNLEGGVDLELLEERLSKQEYEVLSAQGRSDREIYESHGIKRPRFYELKAKWGLTKSAKPPADFELEVATMEKQVAPPEYKLPGTAEVIASLQGIIAALVDLDNLIGSTQSLIVANMLNNYRTRLIEYVQQLGAGTP